MREDTKKILTEGFKLAEQALLLKTSSIDSLCSDTENLFIYAFGVANDKNPFGMRVTGMNLNKGDIITHTLTRCMLLVYLSDNSKSLDVMNFLRDEIIVYLLQHKYADIIQKEFKTMDNYNNYLRRNRIYECVLNRENTQNIIRMNINMNIGYIVKRLLKDDIEPMDVPLIENNYIIPYSIKYQEFKITMF